ncbi:MAG: hypothetical protein HND48_00890 [Chloroflexi bacterium]|nr:hypothetical protein [Chloroflexota bacterium]
MPARAAARERYRRRRGSNPPPDVLADTAPTGETERTRAAGVEQPLRRRRSRRACASSRWPCRAGRSCRRLTGCDGARICSGAGAIAAVILIIVVLGLFKNEPAPTYPNSLWLGSEYSFAERSDEDVWRRSSRG